MNKIEDYHRGIKQFCGVEKCKARKEESQRVHIMFSLRAFLRLELQRIKSGIFWFEHAIKIRFRTVQKIKTLSIACNSYHGCLSPLH
ncbi:hypothetical protein MSBRM_1694 [Methanosarcina barkeri MS]|uniref:Uncharacterized protein n=1 Tax=Methanosarcina barkeri MS TaxID=1434108 RepID=A0A0E3QVK5_METBA|nr:hypothetical protein MSBRM_1694 [Methanosarcina barkeri MS]